MGNKILVAVLVSILAATLLPGASQAAPARATEIVVDDGGSGFRSSAGWNKATSGWTRGCAGNDGDALWTFSRRPAYNNNADWASWAPNLPQGGEYEVFYRVPGISNGRADTQSARYVIHHANGETVVPRSQRGSWCEWVSLGTFTFNAGQNGYVYLGDYTGGENPQTSVVADAVKWVYRGGGGTPPNVADHFDWPVNTPDGSGWGTCGVGYKYLDWACVEKNSQGECTKHEWHPGVDLNWCNHQDRGQPVYAVANGVIVEADARYPWYILIEHTLPDGTKVWSNYKHINRDPSLAVGQLVRRGQQIGTINNDGHVHFEIRNVFLHGYQWAVGKTKDWVRANYANPISFIQSHR